MSTADLPEPDRIDGAPHPRETLRLIGQEPAENAFLEAFNSGRLHHGWLITGPRGVGKATLAWSIARFLLATPPADEESLFGAPPDPTSLHIDPEHPVARRIQAGSEPGLFALRRPYDDKAKRLKAQITVDEVRKLKNFFALSAADGGHRVVIVDSADELNVSAANALLKLLEEPPASTTLLLVSHQPSRLLPTIRSRCRELRLSSLSPDDMSLAVRAAGGETSAQENIALAELSAGSVGEAIRLANLDGLALYSELVDVLGTFPDLDRQRALRLAEVVAGRGKETKFDLLLGLMDVAMSRLARTGVMGHPPNRQAAPHESTVFARLSPTPAAGRHWATLAQEAGDRARHGRAVNVDPASLVFDMFLKMRNTTR